MRLYREDFAFFAWVALCAPDIALGVIAPPGWGWFALAIGSFVVWTSSFVLLMIWVTRPGA